MPRPSAEPGMYHNAGDTLVPGTSETLENEKLGTAPNDSTGGAMTSA